jgi:hypothetical protein
LAWGTRGFPLIQTLGNDVGAMFHADRAHDTAALTAACGRLHSVVPQLRATLPTPDAQLTAFLRPALTDMADAASSCLAGDFSTSASEEAAGNTLFGRVHAREIAITGP